MAEPTAKAQVDAVLLSTEEEVHNLLEMFAFYLGERSRGRSIASLKETVYQLQLILGRILTEHFLNIPPEREAHFCATLATLLQERSDHLSREDGEIEYIGYCIDEMLVPFEYAQEVKAKFPHDPVMRRILAVDIPILLPFDYGMRRRLCLVPELTSPPG